MPLIFNCKTNEGHIIKILAELLQNNIKTGCFIIDEKGIRLRMSDSNNRILIDLELNADQFSLYKYCHDEDSISIGINQNHFHKMLRSIKKKDSISLFIDKDSPTDLGITIIPKENNRVTTSTIKIQNVQQIHIDEITGYDKPIIVPSNEYQKMCKDMSTIGNCIKVTSKRYNIKFSCNGGSIYSREVVFGEIDKDSDENEKEIVQEFDTEQLCRISKIAGLSTKMQIYQAENLALLFKSGVGNLGRICIYTKSKKEIEEEDNKLPDDE
jgi:proliferating cell nuclear antigen